jgi:hypothetical protein
MPRRREPAGEQHRATAARGEPAEPPPLAAIGAALAQVARGVALLGAATPTDAHLERARLLDDWARGDERLPRWSYRPAGPAQEQRLRGLVGVMKELEALGAEAASPLAPLYRARADELRRELEAALAVGTAAFGSRAQARFAPDGPDPRADALAARLLADAVQRAEDAGTAVLVPTDGRDPRSLGSRLRAEVARRKLPFQVRTSPDLTALAAISGDTIWVVEGRTLSVQDVERTVIHEIEAHAVPRARAWSSPVALFALGTARGSDDQEGYALWLEERRGVSSPSRSRELAARHVAVRQMRDGADFVTVVRSLRAAGLPLDAGLRTAERAFRGSDGRAAGLGREQVYLEGYLRVKGRLDAEPGDEAVLAAGQVAVGAIDVLRGWVGTG